MFKYIITFSKTGVMCYTSHLDLMRMFKRTFKKAGIRLAYSQGFNPHPKMGFAQPLSLGYTGLEELMEFETSEEYSSAILKEELSALMPDGLDIISCRESEGAGKTLAARTVAAEYIILIPTDKELSMSGEDMKAAYLGQEAIKTLKRQKKKKEPVEMDIKPMIRQMELSKKEGELVITAVLDSGSISNLSPELLIKTICSFFGIETERAEMSIIRKKLIFK